MWRLRLKPWRVAGALLIGGGLTVALLQILVFDWIRYTLTGTWGGFVFG